MRRLGTIVIAALIAVFAVSLTTWTFAQARANNYMMVGMVVADENIALEVDKNQAVPGDTIVVDRVLAPDAVPEGESRDVVITLDEPATTPNVIVALHADRGKRGVFEFDMDRFMGSPDKPYFVGFEEVARVVSVGETGMDGGSEMDEAPEGM